MPAQMLERLCGELSKPRAARRTKFQHASTQCDTKSIPAKITDGAAIITQSWGQRKVEPMRIPGEAAQHSDMMPPVIPI